MFTAPVSSGWGARPPARRRRRLKAFSSSSSSVEGGAPASPAARPAGAPPPPPPKGVQQQQQQRTSVKGGAPGWTQCEPFTVAGAPGHRRGAGHAPLFRGSRRAARPATVGPACLCIVHGRPCFFSVPGPGRDSVSQTCLCIVHGRALLFTVPGPASWDSVVICYYHQVLLLARGSGHASADLDPCRPCRVRPGSRGFATPGPALGFGIPCSDVTCYTHQVLLLLARALAAPAPTWIRAASGRGVCGAGSGPGLWHSLLRDPCLACLPACSVSVVPCPAHPLLRPAPGTCDASGRRAAHVTNLTARGWRGTAGRSPRCGHQPVAARGSKVAGLGRLPRSPPLRCCTPGQGRGSRRSFTARCRGHRQPEVPVGTWPHRGHQPVAARGTEVGCAAASPSASPPLELVCAIGMV